MDMITMWSPFTLSLEREREREREYHCVCTLCQSQFTDDFLHSRLPQFVGHVRWETERGREVEILTNCECAHDDIILYMYVRG